MPEPMQLFDNILHDASKQKFETAQALRSLIKKLDPDAVEIVWEKQKIAGYGVGPKKMTEHYVYIAPQSGHVNLGFYRGAILPDTKSMMTGSGKSMRHIKIYTSAQTSDPTIAALIVSAINERKNALGLA